MATSGIGGQTAGAGADCVDAVAERLGRLGRRERCDFSGVVWPSVRRTTIFDSASAASRRSDRGSQCRTDGGAVLDHADLRPFEILQEPAVVPESEDTGCTGARRKERARRGRPAVRRETCAPPTSPLAAGWPALRSTVKSSASMVPETSTASMMSMPSAWTLLVALPSCGLARATTRSTNAAPRRAVRSHRQRVRLPGPTARTASRSG